MKTPPSILVTLALTLVIAPLAHAGNTWTGGGSSTNWSDTGNWGGSTPGYGTLTFTTGGAQGTTSVNDNTTAQNMLLWTGTASWTLNNSGGTILSLYDNNNAQAKVENQSTGLVTINAPITFAANNGSPPNPFGEINAVNGPLTFGSGTLTVNGSSVNGIKMFSSGQVLTFNNTVSASGKWFATTGASGMRMSVGGAFTSGDIYLMNGSTLTLENGGSISTSALRLGGDFGTTGSQNQTLGATFAFNHASGGQSFGNSINTVSGNTSGSLLIDSRNTSGSNTLSSDLFLDANLRMQQASGGTMTVSGSTLDLKAQTLTLDAGGSIDVTGALSNSSGSGKVTKTGSGTVTLSNANTHSGDTVIENGTLQFAQGGSASSSILRVGNTTGSNSATLNISDADGGTTIGSTLVVRNGSSGTKTIGGTNTSGVNTFSGTVALDDAVTLSAAAGGTTEFSNAISDGAGAGTYGLLVGGAGTVRFSGGSANAGVALYTVGNGSTLELAKTAGVNAVDSSLVVNNGGTARLINANQISDSVAVTVDGTLNLNGQAETVGSISGASSGAIQTGGAQLIAGQNNASTTFSGIISGSGSFVKKGSGTLTLAGANTYSGDTYAVGGTTQFNSAQGGGFIGTLQLGETSGSDAATLAIGTGGVTLANDLTVRAGSSGIKTIAANNATGTATFSGTTTLNDAVTLRAANGGALTMGAISQGGHGLLVQAASGNTITLAGNITGTGFLEKTATFPGTVVLTGVKSSTGDLRVNDGTFVIGAGGDVTAGTIFLGSNVHQLNTALELSAAGVDIDRNISVENAGGAETRTVSSTATSGTTTLSGWVDLKTNLALNANSGSTLAFTTGVNLGFAGNNDLTLSNSSPVNITGAIAATSGASDLNKSGAGVLTIGGDNTGSLYKLNLAAGTTYLTHANALGTAYSDKINFLTANSELRVGAVVAPASLGMTINNVTASVNVDSGSSLTVGGVIAHVSGTSALTKSGSGTLTLSGGSANTYSGVTTLTGGVLELNKTAGVNAIAGDGNTGTADVTIGGGTLRWLADEQMPSNASISMSSGTLNLNGRAETLYSLSNSGGSFSTGVNGHLIGTGATVTWSGGTNTINDGGLVQDAHIVINGGVNMVEGGATGGTLQLDASGAGLEMTGGVLALASDNSVAGRLLLKGDVTTHASASASEINSTLANTNPGNVDLDGGTRAFTVADGAAASDLSIGAVITNGALTKTGPGTLTLSGANTYAGLTTVSNGTLAYGAANVIGSGNVTVNGSGAVLALGANQSDSVGTVTLDGGGAITGSGTSTLTSTASFEMKSGSASAILAGGVALNKTTSGTVTLTGANMYSGATAISAGALNIQHANALGATAGATTVSSGAALEIQGGITTPAEALTLNGSGVSSGGALRNVSGNNTYAGLVTLGSSSRINSDSGTLTLSNSGAITGSGNTLTLGGAGNVTVNSPLGLGSGGLNKDGAGTATLAGNNQIAGTTAVSAGTLQITGKTAVTAPMTITGTATVDFNGGTLAVDNLSVDATATLSWGTGRLTNASTVGADGTTDVSSTGFQHVLPGKTASITGDLASDAGSILQMHGSPTLYGDIVNGVRFNNIALTGDLNLTAGLHLELDLNPFLLRPISYKGTSASEWGSLPLLTVSGSLTPGAITVSGIMLNDGHGAFTESGFALANGDNGNDLALNTWYVKLDESDSTLYFHYKIMGYVPEPGSFGLLAAGAFALRLARNLARQRRRVSEAPVGEVESVPC